MTLSAWGEDSTAVQSAMSAAMEEFHRADALMSIHRSDSELSMVNRQAATRPVPVSPELFDVLSLAVETARNTEGAFDITLRPILDLWGFITKDHRLPSSTEIAATLPRVGYRKIVLDPARKTVRFTEPGVSIDLGGIGKGVAVDMAIAKLRSLGITNAMVKAGGDLRVMGSASPGRPWTVQLEDPGKQGRRLVIPLRDSALSTSGNYENFFEIKGRRYSHILDPRSGFPVEGLAACTVIAPTCAESDAWATACFVNGVAWSLAKIAEPKAVRLICLPAPSRPQSWLIHRTPNFPASSRIPPI